MNNHIRMQPVHILLVLSICVATVLCEKPIFESMSKRSLLPSRLPEKPASLQAEKITSKSILLTWTMDGDQDPTSGFIIDYGMSSEENILNRFRISVQGQMRNYIISNLRPSTSYVISLRAVNKLGVGPAIFTTAVTKKEEALPAFPVVGLTARVMSSSSIKLQWEMRSDNKPTYIIRYRSNSNLRAYYNVETTKTRIVINGLEPDTEYEFAVRERHPAGVGVWSMAATAKTKSMPLPTTRTPLPRPQPPYVPFFHMPEVEK